MYKNILVPVDESQYSMRIIEQGIRLASIHCAKVSFLYLSPDEGNLIHGDAGLLHAMAPDLFARKYLWQDGFIKAKALGWARTANLEAQFIGDVVVGSVHNSILEQAKKLEADLILMGSHWRASLLERLFGSVTMKVVFNADMPVLVSPAGPEEQSACNIVITHFREVHAVWIAMFDLLLEELEKPDPEAAILSRIMTLLHCVSLEVGQALSAPPLARLLDTGINERTADSEFFALVQSQLRKIRADLEALGMVELKVLSVEVKGMQTQVIKHVIEENNQLLHRAEELADNDMWTAAAEILERDPWRLRRENRQNEIRALFGQLYKRASN